MLAITSPGANRPAAEPLPGRHRQPAHTAPARLRRHEVKLTGWSDIAAAASRALRSEEDLAAADSQRDLLPPIPRWSNIAGRRAAHDPPYLYRVMPQGGSAWVLRARTWAVEGAAGLGRLLAQQLVAAGELVLDVQPKLAARVRLLQAGGTGKNDPHDAQSVAVAALRSRACRPVAAEGHTVVLKIWARRHRDLARARNQVACRLHAVLCELVPGGVRKQITAGQAASVLERVTLSGPIGAARRELAAQFLEDLRRIDGQLREANKKLAAAVRASGTTVTEVFGVGPVNAGTIIGDVTDVNRFPTRDHFAAYNGTAPTEVSSGGRKVYRLSLRGNRRINHAIHMAAVTQIRHSHSDGRAYYEKKIAEGKTHKEALRCLKRKISDAIYARLRADARMAARPVGEGPGGQTGNGSDSSAAGSHPEHRLFGQATPGPATTLRPPGPARAPADPNAAAKRS